MDDDYIRKLATYIRLHGPIPTVRVSSAQSACPYNYWGAVRYEVTLSRAGRPCHRPLGRASSDRRSIRLAMNDAAVIAHKEGRILWEAGAGLLDDPQALELLDCLALRNAPIARKG